MKSIDKPAGLAVAFFAALAMGCATPGTGEGRYLVVSAGSHVVAEIDTGAGGMASCANQLAMTRLPPGFTGKCEPVASTATLPFSYKLHHQVHESDGFKPSSPYWVRTDTKARCASMRDSSARGEKTVILEDRCS
jgi:hypothetical protein